VPLVGGNAPFDADCIPPMLGNDKDDLKGLKACIPRGKIICGGGGGGPTENPGEGTNGSVSPGSGLGSISKGLGAVKYLKSAILYIMYN